MIENDTYNYFLCLIINLYFSWLLFSILSKSGYMKFLKYPIFVNKLLHFFKIPTRSKACWRVGSDALYFSNSSALTPSSTTATVFVTLHTRSNLHHLNNKTKTCQISKQQYQPTQRCWTLRGSFRNSLNDLTKNEKLSSGIAKHFV